ncbi:MAG: cupredoxin domain-containing protein [Candidatus Spechtbacteria bacterium]|nr:cupredoxin domain-containing protein [Candidatus Spechtbacteria bacterium]
MNNKKITMYMAGLVVIAGVAGGVSAYFLSSASDTGPKTQHLTVEIFHEDAWARPAGIEAGLPEEQKVTTQYVWKPNGLYAFKGDTVELTVINNAGTRVHSFVLEEFGIDTGPMQPKTEKTVTFVADKAGTFKFSCGIVFQPPEEGEEEPYLCSADHAYQTGFFVVLER